MSPWLQLISPPACHFDRNSNCHPCFASSESERRLWTHSCVICKRHNKHLGILRHEAKTCCLFEVYLRWPYKRNWTEHSFQRRQWKRELFSCFWTLAVLHTVLPLIVVWFLILVQFCLFFKKEILFYYYLNFFFFFGYLLLAALGLPCCLQAFSHCGQWKLLFIAVPRLLIAVPGLLIAMASLIAQHRALGPASLVVVAHGLSCPAVCGILVPRSGMDPISPCIARLFLNH